MEAFSCTDELLSLVTLCFMIYTTSLTVIPAFLRDIDESKQDQVGESLGRTVSPNQEKNMYQAELSSHHDLLNDAHYSSSYNNPCS